MILLLFLLIALALAWGLTDRQLSRPIAPPPPVVRQAAPTRPEPQPIPDKLEPAPRSGSEAAQSDAAPSGDSPMESRRPPGQ